MPVESNEYTQMQLSFEMNLDLLKIKRTYYDLLDALSDVGGISSLTLHSFAVVVLILNYKHLDNYMAVNLYKLQSKGKKEDQQLKLPYCGTFFDLLPNFLRCCCCKKNLSRNARALEKARDQLLGEMNIIDIVKQLRFFRLAIFRLLTKDQIEELREKSKVTYIDPDATEEFNSFVKDQEFVSNNILYAKDYVAKDVSSNNLPLSITLSPMPSHQRKSPRTARDVQVDSKRLRVEKVEPDQDQV